jgi:hypothetical protein
MSIAIEANIGGHVYVCQRGYPAGKNRLSAGQIQQSRALSTGLESVDFAATQRAQNANVSGSF